MNKNMATVHLSNYLAEADLPLALVKYLPKLSVDPTMLMDVRNCKWDAKSKTLTTPSDAVNDESLVLEKAAWYNNNFEMKMGKTLVDKVRKNQGQLMNLEDIYKIDNNNPTYTTLNERLRTYDGSPGAVRLDIGQRGRDKDEVGIIDKEGDDMSCV